MIKEHEFIVNRKKEFKGLKYILIAKLEKVEEVETTLEKKVLGVSNKFKKMFDNALNENK